MGSAATSRCGYIICLLLQLQLSLSLGCFVGKVRYSCISTDQAGEIQDEVKLLEDKNNTGTKYDDDDEDED